MATETLYQGLILQKGDGNKQVVLKTDYKINNNEIQGVRFLFRQWVERTKSTQKKHCVFNYPEHSGTPVTVALFLYSIRLQLTQPILILCEDDDQVRTWTSHFALYTKFSADDIIVEPTKALLNKQIFIKKTHNLGVFTRRSWSILVVGLDDFKTLPQFPQVEFMVWLTSMDLCKNPSLLKSAHNWIQPNTEFNLQLNEERTWRDRVRNQAVLDQFVFIAKANNRINKKGIIIESKVDHGNHAKRVKNKDVTGRKIKRSKVLNNENDITNISKDDKPLDKMDVEEFIMNEKPVTSETDEHEFGNINDFDQDSCHSEVNCDKIQDNHENESIEKTEKGLEESTDLSNLEDSQHNYDDKDLIDVGENEFLASITNSINDTKNEEDNAISQSIITSEVKESKDIKPNELKETETLEDFTKSNSTFVSQEIKEEKQDIINENVKNDKFEVKHEPDDLESKLNELQEKAMKKFKGSFLDSIF